MPNIFDQGRKSIRNGIPRTERVKRGPTARPSVYRASLFTKFNKVPPFLLFRKKIPRGALSARKYFDKTESGAGSRANKTFYQRDGIEVLLTELERGQVAAGVHSVVVGTRANVVLTLILEILLEIAKKNQCVPINADSIRDRADPPPHTHTLILAILSLPLFFSFLSFPSL